VDNDPPGKNEKFTTPSVTSARCSVAPVLQVSPNQVVLRQREGTRAAELPTGGTISGSCSFVAVVKAADHRHGNDLREFRRLHSPSVRGVLPKR
jgi:CO/xanthine dehydrogenase Mo-binding subunit